MVFSAPPPGTYQFVCTFPGHSFTMFGEFVVLAATPTPASTPSGTYDYQSLLDDLVRVVASVEQLGHQPPYDLAFSVGARSVAVNRDMIPLRIFEFPDDSAADTEAGYVSSNGDNITVPLGGNRYRTAHYEWMAPTHYFKKGRVIVLYVGHDASLVHLLRGGLGPEFAGSFTMGPSP